MSPATDAVAAPTAKTVTADEVVGRLRSGMTVGASAGGAAAASRWRSFRQAATSPTCTSWRLRRPRSGSRPPPGASAPHPPSSRPTCLDPVTVSGVPGLDPHFWAARQAGAFTARTALDEGQQAAPRPPGRGGALPTRRLGSDPFRLDLSLRTVRSPYPGPDGGEGESLVAQPSTWMPPWCTSTWVTSGERRLPRRRPLLRRPDARGRHRRLRERRADRAPPPTWPPKRATSPACGSAAVHHRGGGDRGAWPTECPPGSRGRRLAVAVVLLPPPRT